MIRWRALVAAAWCWAGMAVAQPLALPAPPQAGLAQHPGAAVPLDAQLRNDAGAPVRLGASFRPGQPVLLVPGYYRCTQLCGLLMQGLLQALHDSGLPRSTWRIVRVSIDPADTPADARRQRARDLAYARFLDGDRPSGPPLQLDLLAGDADQVQRIAQAVGWTAQPLPATAGEDRAFAHPATVVVITPAGHVSRYLQGVQFDPAQLRLALVEAADGGIGGFGDRLALLCAHLDPVVGRYSGGVLAALRATALLTVAALVALVWRQRSRRGRP